MAKSIHDNAKIHGITDSIYDVHEKAIIVIERGCDRSELIKPISAGKFFCDSRR